MARKLTDLCDDIIYEAGQVQPRPARIKSLAREIKRKYAEAESVKSLLDANRQLGEQLADTMRIQPHECNHPDWALSPMTTGDGTPVNFCSVCKGNILA